MQRSVELQVKRRMAKRRDPRARFLGFTSRQWPFLYVLFGNWLFALLFFFGAKFLWHWRPQDWTVGDRLALVIKDAVFAILPAVIGICIIAAQRLDPNMWVRRGFSPDELSCRESESINASDCERAMVLRPAYLQSVLHGLRRQA